MADSTAISEGQLREYMRAEEIGPAFEGLSADDKLKLHAIEAILRRGTGLGQGDLLRESICRALEGDRKCPRNVSLMAFLVMTMKSIASHLREKNRLIVIAPEPALANLPKLPSAPSPEGAVILSSILEDLYRQLGDDEQATLVLMGWTDGLRGKSLREATGLDQSQLDYAIKRIRTLARKLYPDGWMT